MINISGKVTRVQPYNANGVSVVIGGQTVVVSPSYVSEYKKFEKQLKPNVWVSANAEGEFVDERTVWFVKSMTVDTKFEIKEKEKK